MTEHSRHRDGGEYSNLCTGTTSNIRIPANNTSEPTVKLELEHFDGRELQGSGLGFGETDPREEWDEKANFKLGDSEVSMSTIQSVYGHIHGASLSSEKSKALVSGSPDYQGLPSGKTRNAPKLCVAHVVSHKTFIVEITVECIVVLCNTVLILASIAISCRSLMHS
ncbi:hypothetical protein BJ138DRAFT_80779 [Hygrophoropsis aurantiaca]|uniref:Uncharacterized protein n=1 Tax=Hygrophoropsis aurantiaca TaxID=72124 RepID=A0ACB8ACU4_9AGAM|nr:hypothetical protein BJ138DRAFT_80779 [Hygrophoropsis aurantiaca]